MKLFLTIIIVLILTCVVVGIATWYLCKFIYDRAEKKEKEEKVVVPQELSLEEIVVRLSELKKTDIVKIKEINDKDKCREILDQAIEMAISKENYEACDKLKLLKESL